MCVDPDVDPDLDGGGDLHLELDLLWVPQSTQNKTAIQKKRIQTEENSRLKFIATNPFLNQIFLRSSVPSLGFPHPFGQAGGCGGFALREAP